MHCCQAQQAALLQPYRPPLSACRKLTAVLTQPVMCTASVSRHVRLSHAAGVLVLGGRTTQLTVRCVSNLHHQQHQQQQQHQYRLTNADNCDHPNPLLPAVQLTHLEQVQSSSSSSSSSSSNAYAVNHPPYPAK
eukprot:jgi/Chrzof1/3645/Cz13g03180.t1